MLIQNIATKYGSRLNILC